MRAPLLDERSSSCQANTDSTLSCNEKLTCWYCVDASIHQESRRHRDSAVCLGAQAKCSICHLSSTRNAVAAVSGIPETSCLRLKIRTRDRSFNISGKFLS